MIDNLPDFLNFSSISVGITRSEIMSFFKKHKSENLPLVDVLQADNRICFIALSEDSTTFVKFFYEMISKWFLPGDNVCVEYYLSRRCEFFGKDCLLIEATLSFFVKLSSSYLSRFLRELRLGLTSVHHSKKILEGKLIFSEEIVTSLYERIAKIVSIFPKTFGYDIFQLMQKFLVLTSDDFRTLHDYKNISRIIYILYVMKNKLTFSNFLVKLVNWTTLSLPFGSRLGVFVGMGSLKKNYCFRKDRLLTFFKKELGDVQLSEGSCFMDPASDGFVLYMDFLGCRENIDLADLQSRVKDLLPSCIEAQFCPLAMPPHEEELTKYISTLSKSMQLQDLPQLVVIFDRYEANQILFSSVIVFPKKKDYEIVDSWDVDGVLVKVDRVRMLGDLSDNFTKCGLFLKISIPIHCFFRDNVLDIHLARQSVVNSIKKMFGDIRDYNGGMNGDQMEILRLLKDSLNVDQSLVEEFFYSITPTEVKSILRISTLKELFHLVNESHRDFFFRKNKSDLYIYSDRKSEYLLVDFLDNHLKRETLVIKAKVPVIDKFYCIALVNNYCSDDEELLKRFFDKKISV